MRKYAFFTTQRIQAFHVILAVRTIIVLNGINRMAFRMDKESVLCEVGAEALYVSRRTVTAEGLVWFQSKPRRICGGQNGAGKGGSGYFHCILSVSFHHYFIAISTVSCQYHSTITS